jgi:hypothetical protein
MSRESTQFKPGQIADPRGRPKGSRHRLSEKFLADLVEHWDENGPTALARALADDPAAYCRVVASLLPKQSEKIENPLHGLSEHELDALERHLEDLRRAAIAGAVDQGPDGSGE